MRLFVALNLPEKEKHRIYRKAAPLREEDLPVRWVEPDNFHLTMKFLGDVPAEGVEPVEDALQGVADGNAAFEARVAGFGAFPTVRRPRVLWVGVEPSPPLRCLKQDLEWALAEVGFQRETRAFHPHLTVGRARKGRGAGVFRDLDRILGGIDYEGAFQVRTLDLMRSRLSREGPHYSILSSSPMTTGR